MKRGFTLVELSIVLVIIGLLIGGVLVAQSMISTAKITSQVRQLQQFDIAVTNFKNMYGGLPGDNKAFELSITVNPIGATGNNNGIIEDLSACANCIHDAAEFTNFWFQLSISGMLTDGHNYAIMSGADLTPDVNEPRAILTSQPNNGALGVLAYGIVATGKNYYELQAGSVSWSYGGPVSLNAKDLAALDAKMDDGQAVTGKITTRVVGTGLSDATIATEAELFNCVNSTGGYKLDSAQTTAAHCLARIEMFSQSGGAL